MIKHIIKHKLKVQEILAYIGVNKAVFFGALTRGWTALAGVVTVFLVASYFSPELQGYYFTFNSLLALQIFVEFGLCAVIIYFASHEWSKLGFDEKGNIKGDESALSRLRSLAKVSFLWYFLGGTILIIGLSLTGYIFFLKSGQNGVNWAAPWFALCFFTGVNMWLLPAFSLLEGSNQVSQVYYYRFIQGLFRSIATWAIIALGGKLWATVGAVFIPLFWTVYYLVNKYSSYFKALFKRVAGPKLNWKQDVWPMHWRMAVSGLSQYFSFFIFIPVLFYFQGAVAAGQMGMTWSIVNALSLIAFVWIFARAPEFGILIAKKEYVKLDKLFLRSGLSAFGIAILGSIVVFSFVSIIYTIGHPLSLRFLPPLPTLLFLLATVLMQISLAQGNYLRAHKKEPFMGLSVAAAVMIFTLVMLTSARWGALGITASYLSVVALFIIPYGTWIWIRCRKNWHAEDIMDSKITLEEDLMDKEDGAFRYDRS